MTTPRRQPTLFIPHGGGPCFFMDPPFGPKDTWERMAAYLRGIAARLPARPRAVLVISGHWECERPTVTSGARPELIYDYYGFPPHTYALRYPAPGDPDLAARVQSLLGQAGIACDADPDRGFDHGVFIPFLLLLPQADIPIVQLSLTRDLSPERHLALGRALAPLRDEGVLIVGSGMSYHNLRDFLGSGGRPGGRGDAESDAFDAWLTAAVENPDPQARDHALSHWEQAPAARACHPRAEHLIPLMVAAGAAGNDGGVRDYADHVWGKALSGFRFG